MKNDWFREELILAHLNMRRHLFRIIEGLSKELLLTEFSDEKEYPHMLSLILHIGSAETYWFHRAKHDIGPKFTIETFDDINIRLKANTDGIIRVVKDCEEDQLLIIPPTSENGPSVAWCLLRTYQHGLYHTAQISKMRHIIDGCPPLSVNDQTWNSAVDSVISIIERFQQDLKK